MVFSFLLPNTAEDVTLSPKANCRSHEPAAGLPSWLADSRATLIRDPTVITGIPEAQGLYDPRNEHDACGIGFVANIKGQRSHDVIAKGIQVLVNLTHRGACGCDPETGDGAGVLIQIPHRFFARECGRLGFTLPPMGEYGVGMTFLPVEPHARLQKGH